MDADQEEEAGPPKQAKKAGQDGRKGQAGCQAAGPSWPYPLLPTLLTVVLMRWLLNILNVALGDGSLKEEHRQPIPVISSSNMGRLGVGSHESRLLIQGGFESHRFTLTQ